MTESIYFVFNPAGDVPKRRHATVHEAREEARRLATLQQGQTFFVVRAIESITYRVDPFQVTNYCKKEK